MMKALLSRLAITAATILLGTPLYAEQPQATPAEIRIAAARRQIEADPERPEAHAALALALARRARETADPAYYDQASDAVAKALAHAPDNRDAERARIWVELGRHEFAHALELAAAYNDKVPDDVLGYGFLVDANIELGNYDAAERAAQWMLDLRPGNIPGLTRAAYLRELFGDVDGALDMMRMALQRTQPAEAEDRAWIVTQIAHLHLSRGRVETADEALRQALDLFPDYHYALGILARVRTAQNRHDEAVALLERRYRNAPHAENLYVLAQALARAGRKVEARKAFLRFEQASSAEMNKADNSNHELVFYYADHARNPARALYVAKLEFARRQDVHTLDAYAWALYRNGRYADARMQMSHALEVGIKDAAMLYRAGAIFRRSGDRLGAIARLGESLDIDARSAVARQARELLAESRSGSQIASSAGR